MNKKSGPGEPAAADDAAIKSWRLEELLGSSKEAIIEHEGQIYRLRITSNGKLILTK